MKAGLIWLFCAFSVPAFAEVITNVRVCAQSGYDLANEKWTGNFEGKCAVAGGASFAGAELKNQASPYDVEKTTFPSASIVLNQDDFNEFWLGHNAVPDFRAGYIVRRMGGMIVVDDSKEKCLGSNHGDYLQWLSADSQCYVFEVYDLNSVTVLDRLFIESKLQR
jgi:hypothetical protein